MTTTATSRALPWALIGAACLGSFAATSSGTTRAPFLIEMSHDLEVEVSLIANIVSLTSITWGIASALGGYLSELLGRRVLLVGGLFSLSLMTLAQAFAGSFLWVALFAALSGACSGTYSGVVFAEVSARVEDGQRGRALGWVMSGQSLTLVVGVPLAAWVGSMIGWRGWMHCTAALSFVACLGLLVTVRGAGTVAHTGGRPVVMRRLPGRVLGLLFTGVAERTCYGLAAIYFATFLLTVHHLTLAELAIPLVLFALGNIAGTILGGQLADRLRDRLLTFAVTLALSGAACLVLFMWHPSLTVSVALGFLYVLLNALGRPSFMASLAAVPEEIRGTVLGLNGAFASLGWICAAALGGVAFSTVGFEGFGPLGAGLGIIGTLGALACRRQGR
jgi:MFS transporter, DHA1 family, inner membrane transport protein